MRFEDVCFGRWIGSGSTNVVMMNVGKAKWFGDVSFMSGSMVAKWMGAET